MTPIVELSSVSFAYPRSAGRPPFAIRKLSLTVEAGEILCVIGPNASGKTTLIRLVGKLLTPDGGDICLDGISLGRLGRAEVATRVAVLAQDLPRGFPYTAEEVVLMGRFPHGPRRFFESEADRAVAAAAMAATGVLEFRAAPLDRLSGGERQRVMLARALAQEPSVLVLDEPTAHLDLRYQVELVGLLRGLNRQSGLTVILVSHDLNLAGEIGQRLLLLSAGAAARLGPPESVLDPALLESVYGCRMEVTKHPDSHRPTVAPVWPDPGPDQRRR